MRIRPLSERKGFKKHSQVIAVARKRYDMTPENVAEIRERRARKNADAPLNPDEMIVNYTSGKYGAKLTNRQMRRIDKKFNLIPF